jgi:N-acetylmuramoyl-L-alanine amidase
VVIIHTNTDACDTEALCSAEVREIQKMHMDQQRYEDIAYNFLVGGDGQTYEGRGWDLQGAFARGVNNKSLGIAFIGKAVLIFNLGKDHMSNNKHNLTQR